MRASKFTAVVKLIFIAISLLALLAIIWMYLRKAGLQLMYLRKKKGRSPGSIRDFWKFNYSDPKARKIRWEAFMLFPMLYPVAMDDKDETLKAYKLKVKRLHIGIYLMLIFLVVLIIMSEKVFPA